MIAAGIDDERYRAILQDIAKVCQSARSFAVELWLQCFPGYVDDLAQRLKDYSTALRTLEAEAGEDQRTGNELDPCEVYFMFGSQLQVSCAAGTLSMVDYEWFSVRVHLAIAELDFGSPEGSEGSCGESPERMEEVPAPLPAASSLVSPQSRSVPAAPSPGVATPVCSLPCIVLSSAGPSSAGAGVVPPAVAHASNASAPAPAFKVCRGCFAEVRFMCLAVSSLPHLPSSVHCECCPPLQSVQLLPLEGFRMHSHAVQVGFALFAFFARCVAA